MEDLIKRKEVLKILDGEPIYSDVLNDRHDIIEKVRGLHKKNIMKFKQFIDMYDNLNGIAIVNDNTLKTIVKDVAWKIVKDRADLYEKEVVSFGFYDGELTVRVR